MRWCSAILPRRTASMSERLYSLDHASQPVGTCRNLVPAELLLKGFGYTCPRLEASDVFFAILR